MTIEDQIREIVNEELSKREMDIKLWDLKDLASALNMKTEWVAKNILYPHREELDIENGGFVRYPRDRGNKYRIPSERMKKWINDNLVEVL